MLSPLKLLSDLRAVFTVDPAVSHVNKIALLITVEDVPVLIVESHR